MQTFYLLLRAKVGEAVCLSRMQFRIGVPVSEPTSLQVAMIACRVAEGTQVDVLDLQFFDDESVVLVLRQTHGDRRGERVYSLTSTCVLSNNSASVCGYGGVPGSGVCAGGCARTGGSVAGKDCARCDARGRGEWW